MKLNSWARDADVISGAVLAALGVYIVTRAQDWAYSGPDGPGPGFFPTWYGVGIIALSLLLIGNKIAGGRSENGAFDWQGTGRALMAWGAFAACAWLLKPLGFILSFGLLVFFIVKVIFGRSLVSAGLTAVGTTAAFYLVFSAALGVSLPTGVLGF
jgi:putative tricarboxylic transport membrane protein